MSRDPDTEAWIDEARRADVWTVLGIIRPGHGLKETRGECVGPCPACGGKRRFSVNRKKNVWICRMSGRGGDAIALVEYLDGADFLGAVETVTGRPPPQGQAGRRADPAEIAERQRRAEEQRLAAERDAQDFRAREIRRAHDIWSKAGRLAGSMAEAYLRHRGITAAPDARLRAVALLPYWHHMDCEGANAAGGKRAGLWKQIHEGPALVAAIVGRDGRFIGCHCTWIDARLATRSGKADIVHPVTGELLAAKKVRGSQKGGHIHLGGPKDARRLVVGEGIETVGSARQDEMAVRPEVAAATLYWSAVNLQNLGGKAAASVPHPSLTMTDARGRVRRCRVPGPEPDLSDTDVLVPPEQVSEIIMLGDGDSDRCKTENTLRRGARRWARPGRRIAAAWADAGADFNDMLRQHSQQKEVCA